MTLSVKFNTRVLEKNLQKIRDSIKDKDLEEKVLGQTAEGILGQARRRAPFRFGELRDSDLAVKGRPAAGQLTFGFNKRYADIMDRGWKTAIIRPIKAKALRFPVTRRAARGSAKGRRRKTSKKQRSPLRKITDFLGITKKKRRRKVSKRTARNRAGVKPGETKFVFAKSVRTRKAQKGSRRGPNFYFSGTIRDQVANDRILKTMGRLTRRLIREAAKEARSDG